MRDKIGVFIVFANVRVTKEKKNAWLREKLIFYRDDCPLKLELIAIEIRIVQCKQKKRREYVQNGWCGSATRQSCYRNKENAQSEENETPWIVRSRFGDYHYRNRTNNNRNSRQSRCWRRGVRVLCEWRAKAIRCSILCTFSYLMSSVRQHEDESELDFLHKILVHHTYSSSHTKKVHKNRIPNIYFSLVLISLRRRCHNT